MNTIEILKTHNSWRRGDDTRSMDDLGFSVTELGLAIDDAIRIIDERDQLAAQVERLREALKDLSSCMEGVIEGDYVPDSFTLQPANAALDETPAQALAEHNANVFDGWLGQVKYMEGLSGRDIVESAEQYADELRTTNKSGGGDEH